MVWINFINSIIWNYTIVSMHIKNVKIKKILKIKEILQKMFVEKKNIYSKFIKIEKLFKIRENKKRFMLRGK